MNRASLAAALITLLASSALSFAAEDSATTGEPRPASGSAGRNHAPHR